MNLKEKKTPKNFWIDVAVDYAKDQAWILGQSQDCRDCDLIDGSEIDDSGIDRKWIENVEPGLYRLFLKPWSQQGYEGDWDGGIDVIKVECRLTFSVPRNVL